MMLSVKQSSVLLKRSVAKKNVKMYLTKQQKDGWRCGYISVWWKVFMSYHGKNYEDRRPIEGIPDKPPAGWEELVWMLLAFRDSSHASRKASVLNLALSHYVIRAMNDHDFNFVSEAKKYLLEQLEAARL